MFNIYLSNRLENLSHMLGAVLQQTAESVFEQQHILVQHKGMQHWLLMQLAEQNGIAMNLAFEPPVGAIWSILRELDPTLAKESPYKSSILSWRIYQLLASDAVIHDPIFAEPTAYWHSIEPSQTRAQKRFQLAKNISDLFEQYQIYRPEWITQWSAGQINMQNQPNWQAKLWFLLVQQEPRHPVAEMQRLINVIKEKSSFRPKQRILFGFNTLPPLWLDFFVTLAEKQEMHLFLLSPCNEFWQDIASEKFVARQRVKWLDLDKGVDCHFYNLGNPLLAALGQQGQAFLKLLYDVPQSEIAAFSESQNTQLLHHIQDDILFMREPDQSIPIDDSITITSSHSALREVQHLHDWLLQQIELDPTLTPKDVLVMCPSVEDYAPYIEAIFTRARDYQHTENRLPCSIADRSFSSNMTFVQLFNQILQLPDSRFSVSQIVEMMRSPYVQLKFGWQEQDIQTLLPWLQNASIHWGLSAEHKQQFNLPAKKSFTWQQGLSRLLLGFAYQDENTLLDQTVLLPDVEGDQAQLLGRLLLFIDTLQQHAKKLNKARSATDWCQYLLVVLEDLFALDDQQTFEYRIVHNAIIELQKWTQAANPTAETSAEIDLGVVQAYFDIAFNQPQQSQHFMTGQVTFCSLIPMRSIPFKVIALLGLNDGDFPRQKNTNGMDLLAQDKPRLGDRSRRGDDRYLFLECLLSARDKLYVSYQGNQIKDDSERQPSSVLVELMAYLGRYYGWQSSHITRTPLQVFSPDNYSNNKCPSFDQGWLALATRQPQAEDQNKPKINTTSVAANALPLDIPVIQIDDLVNYFSDPMRYYCNKVLNLYLTTEIQTLMDSEPFSADYLIRYQIQQDLVQCGLVQDQALFDKQSALHQYSGVLPDHAIATKQFEQWQTVAKDYANSLHKKHVNEVAYQTIKTTILGIEVNARLPLVTCSDERVESNIESSSESSAEKNTIAVNEDNTAAITAVIAANIQHQLFWRLADAKGKDKLRLWLHHLIANSQSPTRTDGFYRNSKDVSTHVYFDPMIAELAIEALTEFVRFFMRGQTQPLLVDVTIAELYFSQDRRGELKPFTAQSWLSLWQSGPFSSGFNDNPYYQHLFSTIPDWTSTDAEQLSTLYSLMMSSLNISKEAAE
ncbi:exodeoxyribonuclease V subunit gamma [Algibacillus agarilyticus]|uniref:exodeoxyribonuclease V subunit gamma n=1 Tax=Algibacillus agarilyticus TaxID=2234133 RepID=UPI000DD0C119|nr:exodeoxyribonuclease V subunit gamma [Algibacillus agarilyticus]